MSNSLNTVMPYVTEGQAQGEVTVNDFLTVLDALVLCVVKDILNTAPGSPAEGDRYAIDSAASGVAWSGHSNKLALFKGGVWKIIPGQKGWFVFNQTTNQFLRHNGNNWQKGTTVVDFTDNTGGTVTSTLAAIAAGAGYTQADMVAVKNALASLAAKVNVVQSNLRTIGIQL